MKSILVTALAGAFLVTALPVRADVRALLVGVGEYLHLQDADLRGPANDVGLMAGALLARGADHVRVLADPGAMLPGGVDPAGRPTRAAILDGLEHLAAQAGPDDTVIFYFSGHGALAPDLNGDADAGYDEILLPSDARGWNGGIGAVENAIVDDEFQPLFQAILDTGATLIAILDACHSATGFRAASGVATPRFVGSVALGLPDAPPAAPELAEAPASLDGSFAFLHAAQAEERSFEYPFGDKDDPANWHGDFSRALATVLSDVGDLTWAQALRGAAALIQRDSTIVVQRPAGEGPMLDSPVFGAVDPGGRRVAFADGVLQAGRLSGYGDGAIFDLFDAAEGGAPVGRAVLRQVGADTASLVSEDGTVPATGHAVQVQPGVPGPFRISAPVVRDMADYAPILDAMGALAAAGLPEGVEWNATNPDAVPILTDGRLALSGADGVLDPEGAGSTPRMGDDPAEFFERAARVHRLRRALALAGSGPAGGFSLPQDGLSQKIERVAGTPGADGCLEPSSSLGPFDPDLPIAPCDRLWLSLNNTSSAVQDVTVLYVDRALNTSVLWPEPGLSNRIDTGETQEIGLEIRSPDGLPGQEEIIVIAVAAQPDSPRTVLSALADPAASKGGEGASALQQFLESASEPGAVSRNFGFNGALAPLKITRTRLHLVPGPR